MKRIIVLFVEIYGGDDMIEKRFQVTDGRDDIFSCDWSVTDYADGGIIHHPMTSENMANVMCNLLNELNDENEHLEEHLDMVRKQRDSFKNKNNELMKLDENRKEYQRTLESKIKRLKDRIKVLEKR